MSPGDLVICQKGPFTHVGVVTAGGYILHNKPGLGEHVSTLADFSHGAPHKILHTPAHLRQIVVVNAARIAADPREYDALLNNCEHTVARAMGLQAHSPQLAFALTLAIGAGLLFLLSRR